MRKKLIIAILVIVCAVGATVGILISVLKKKTDVTVSVAGNPEAIIAPGEFPYGEYKLLVTRGSGKTEEIALTEEMIPEEERLKFYREGEQTVAVVYEGARCEIKVTVRRKDFEGLAFNDLTVVYTGEPVEMTLSGNLPADATVRYPRGNSFTNAGEYDVTAVVYGDAYAMQTFTARLVIEKATYDMSGVSFCDGEFTYDGTEKSVSVTGELPSGLSVSYTVGAKTGNSATDAGMYEVRARFSSENGNYNPVEDMTASLTIHKAAHDMSGVAFPEESFVYDGRERSVGLNETTLPKGVAVREYRIRKIRAADGTECSAEETVGNGATDAGTYLVTAHFSIADGKNYQQVEPVSGTFAIARAEYSLENVNLDWAEVPWDGNEHSLHVSWDPLTGKPDWIAVSYTIRKFDDEGGYAGEAIEGNGATEAGGYEVTAHFSVTDDNYCLSTESLTAYLIITSSDQTAGGQSV
ncbi:MAG: MBG domain-containing protein [Candidatus Gallimonas sp.]